MKRNNLLLICLLLTSCSNTTEKKETTIEGKIGFSDNVTTSESSSSSISESASSSVNEISFSSIIDNKVKNINRYNFPLYINYDLSYDNQYEVVTFDDSNIRYIDITNAMSILKILHANNLNDENFAYTISENKDVAIISRANGSYMEINALNNTIRYNDYCGFNTSEHSLIGEFLPDYGVIESSDSTNINFVGRNDFYQYYKLKEYTLLELDNYNIAIVSYNDKVYVPFQTFFDLSNTFLYFPICALSDGIYSPYLAYTSIDYRSRYNQAYLEDSYELLDYNYNETCLYMDTCYGLDYKHGFDSIDTFFKANNIKELFYKSSKDANQAISDMINYFDDGHSSYRMNNANTSNSIENKGNSFSRIELSNRRTTYVNERNKAFPEGCKAYDEIGNTAFIYFNQFGEIPNDLYEKGIPSSLSEANNAASLFVYAYSRITREDSPIDNIVIDITTNGGGDTRCLTFIAGMFIDEVKFISRDTVDNSICVSSYSSDINLDHKIDENDKLVMDKNIYLLQSDYSFSCANIFSSLFKNNHLTILGLESGGGSCAVAYASTAFGGFYQFSSNSENMTYDNGSYTTIDEGIEADIYLNYTEFYDFETLANYIENRLK